MDFAAGLANLEQAADNSRNNNNDRRRGRDNNYHGGDDRRYQPRPRHHYDNNRRDYGRQDHHHRGNHHRHHQQQDRALDGLVRYGYRLPRGPYHRPPPIPHESDRPLHVCLLAISIDDLPYEAIWRAWAESSKNPRYVTSLLCHAKFPDQVKSDWLKQRLLLQPRRIVRGNSLSDPEYLSHKPAWGSVEITRAMVDLLDQGMQMGKKRSSKPDEDARFSPNRFFMETTSEDFPPADKFVFISETCVPVTTLDECMDQLFAAAKPDPAADSSAPRWVPPPAKEAKEEPAKQDNWDNEDDDDKEKDKEEESPKKEERKINPFDLPINRQKREEEAVVYLDTSWVNARNFNSPNTPQNKYERDQFNNIHRVVPKRYRWKADQWMVLSRTHAAAVLDIDHSSNLPSKDQLWSCFRRINASDEMYFPTTLSLAGVLVDHTHNTHNTHNHTYHVDKPAPEPCPASASSSPWLERRQVTYTDWSMGMRNPASFTKGIRDFANIARLARGKKCLLARKFCPYLEIPGKDASTLERTGDISAEEWRKELETIRKFENGGADSSESGGASTEDKKDEEGSDEAKEEEEGGAEDEEEEGNEGDQKEEEEGTDEKEEGDDNEEEENDDGDGDDGDKEEEEEQAQAEEKDSDDDDSDESESNMHSFMP